VRSLCSPYKGGGHAQYMVDLGLRATSIWCSVEFRAFWTEKMRSFLSRDKYFCELLGCDRVGYRGREKALLAE